MIRNLSDGFRAHTAMLLFAFLVSTSFTVGRAITFALDPAALTFLRFAMAAVIFCGVAALSQERFELPSLSNWMRYFFLAALLVVFFVTMFEGLRWAVPLSAGAVFTLTPFMTAIIAYIAFRQAMPTIGYAGLIVAGAASLWIMFGGDTQAMTSLSIGKGELIFLVGCASYSGYAPAVKKLHKGGGIIYLTLWTFVAGLVILFAYGHQAILSSHWTLVSPLVYLGIAWLAVATTAITFYLIQYAALRLPSTKVMSYTLLIPAFVLLQSLANGGAWPSMSTMLALVVLTGAMLVLQRA